MQAIILVGVCIAAALHTACASDAEEADPAVSGPLVFESTTVALGTVYEGREETAVFQFQSAADEPIELTGLRTGCSCTAVSHSGNNILPRATGAITAKLQTKGKAGHVVEKVFLAYADAAGQSYVQVLELHADVSVEGKLMPKPLSLYWANAEIGSTWEQTVVLEPIGKARPVEIKEIEAPSWVNVNSVARSQADAPITLNLRVQAPNEPGFFMTQVVVHTTDDLFPTVEIPILGRVSGRISISPAGVVRVLEPDEDSWSASVLLTGARDRRIRIRTTSLGKHDATCLSVGTEAGETSTYAPSATLLLTGDSRCIEGGRFSDTLRVIVEVEGEREEEVVAIPVHLFVRQAPQDAR